MRTIVIIVVLSIIAAVAIIFVARPGMPVVPTSPAQAQAPVIIEGTTSVPYQDTYNGFSLWRPQASDVLTQVDNVSLAPTTHMPVVSLALSPSLFSGTNLSQAQVTIGISSSSDVISSCLTAGSGESEGDSAQIAGVTFDTFFASEAGAGNVYNTKSYRAVHNGECVEIVELLHSTNIGNYPPGTVKQFDQTKFSDYLDAIAKTFSFIESSGSGVEGRVYAQAHCSNINDSDCGLQTNVSAYKNAELITTATSSESGYYKLPLDPGQYELRVEDATHRCSSIGVVVPARQFISANITCEGQ